MNFGKFKNLLILIFINFFLNVLFINIILLKKDKKKINLYIKILINFFCFIFIKMLNLSFYWFVVKVIYV